MRLDTTYSFSRKSGICTGGETCACNPDRRCAGKVHRFGRFLREIDLGRRSSDLLCQASVVFVFISSPPSWLGFEFQRPCLVSRFILC